MNKVASELEAGTPGTPGTPDLSGVWLWSCGILWDTKVLSDNILVYQWLLDAFGDTAEMAMQLPCWGDSDAMSWFVIILWMLDLICTLDLDHIVSRPEGSV